MKDLTTGSIHKNFIAFTIPIMLSSLLSTTFAMVDTSIAGLFLGAKGLAALGATTSFFGLIDSVFYGLTYGVSVVVAKTFGAKQYSKLRTTFFSNLLLIVVVLSILSAIAIPLWSPVFDFLNVDPEITKDARIYYTTICLNMVFAMVNHYCIFCSNSIGETKFPLFISVFGSITNIMGNLLTVAVFDLGVLGLGASTLVSTFLCSVLNLARFQYYFKKMGVHREPYRFRFEHVTSLFSYSLPNMFQQSAMFLISFLTAPIYNGLGYTAVAVLSITSRIQSLLTTLYYAMARTLGNFAAQCIGAKKYYKIRPAIGVAMLQSCFFFVPLLILMWLFPNYVCSIFVDQATEMSVTEYLLIYIRRFLPLVFLNMVCAVFHSTFRGIKANHHLIISTATSGVVNLVACYFLTPIYGIVGVFIGSTSSWLIECIYIAVIYFTGLWVPKSIRQQVLASPGDSSIEEEPI